jgi:hypothetical protein
MAEITAKHEDGHVIVLSRPLDQIYSTLSLLRQCGYIGRRGAIMDSKGYEERRSTLILTLKHRAQLWEDFSKIQGNEYQQYQEGRAAAYQDAIDCVRIWLPHWEPEPQLVEPDFIDPHPEIDGAYTSR